MSLFSSIGLANNTLQANQIALQVIGQNIANANTPGYIREEVVLTPAATQKKGNLLLGLGVRVEAIIQKIDLFLEERLRGAVSDRVSAETLENTYMQLEGVIGELSDTDLSTSMTNFFNAINDVVNEPTNITLRNLAVLQGGILTGDVNRLYNRVNEMRSDLNDQVIDMAEDINRLIGTIRLLNVQIANLEGGDVSASDAVGLRDQRLQAMEELSELIDVRIKEQPSGGVAIYNGGDFLVFEGVAREVEVLLESEQGLATASIQLADTDSPITASSGKLAGLITGRDTTTGGFLTQLDNFSKSLTYEFNKLYSQGQGINWYDNLTSEFPTIANNLTLDQAGLEFAPTNGSFTVLTRNTVTDQTQRTTIQVNLDGIGTDATLSTLAADLDAVAGISASTTTAGRLTISAASSSGEFTFDGDTSGVLAALGLNTFFTGSTARNLGVNSQLQTDPSKFAASRDTGTGPYVANEQNALVLAGFLLRPLESQNNQTLAVLYDRLTGETTQASSIARAVAEGARVFEETLRGQKMATSGVSIDEEAMRMIAFQRSFQASAKYIATLNDLLGLLVTL
ncbi:MAG: flagellar hook-associated protein FlgK [Candidatus Nealsonbacteria bacterium]|nr:flagellar hook-associated protein FlgK [Candidatus Nealsonbacteria bacterium]